MKKISRTLIVVAVAAALAGGAYLYAARERPRESAAAPKPALTVTTVQPQSADMPRRLAANGNVAPWQEAIIGSQAAGLRLTDVRVNVGDAVRAGDVLAVFAADSVQAEMAQATAAFMEAEAAAADAANNAARASTLKDSGALSTQQINQFTTGAQTAQARVEAARAAVASQRLRLRDTRVQAPDDGIISARNATVGAVVPAGAELFRMIRQGRLEWRAEVTATELGSLRPGAVATVAAPGGAVISGRVRMIAPTVDLQSRIALVYVDLPAQQPGAPALRAGMYARGEFDLGSTPALTVPQQVVVVRDGFSYVFRINPDNRVSQLKVSIGRRLGERIEIVDGIAPDALLALDGAGFLNDGDLVRRADAGAGVAAGGASAR
ncbi:MAG: efflux RND transporter periplasmic adaptor subunit [Noviherbaspirillum sp.]